jgi:enoyl-[acyl-carrier protein] reductase III
MKSMQSKAVLVTGGSRGIGRAIALGFARSGANVAINYFRGDRAAAETEQEITDHGVRCLRLRAHLGDPQKITGLFEKVEQGFGRLDVLVNNAASGVQRSADELEPKHWDWAMNINARAAWLCSIEAAKLMTDGGSIVNITSLGSQKVLPYYFSVGTSKAALEAVTRYLAVELAPRGISVNAVAGGYVRTQALDHFPNRDDMVEAAETRTLDGSLLDPDDLAGVVMFLCSEQARMIRGQVIVVDGGATLRA